MQQYTNCSAPTTTRNAMNVSNSFTLCGVFFTYLLNTSSKTSCALAEFPNFDDVDFDADFGVVVAGLGGGGT